MSKHTKMARAAVPPPQSRGAGPRLLPPGAPPMATRQEIGEIDALKYRLAIQKDNNVKSMVNSLEDKKKILAQEEENLRLRINLIRMENKRDIGHLDIQPGDNLVEENGKWHINRAPRRGPIPRIALSKPLPAGPAKATEEEPTGEGEPPDGIDEGNPGIDETQPGEEPTTPEAGEAAPAVPPPTA